MEKITKQVENLFNEKEQWDAFLELCPQLNAIKGDWTAKIKSPLNKIFNVDDIVEGWEFDSTGYDDYRWYLKEFGRDTIFLSFSFCHDSPTFGLFANDDTMDIRSLKTKLREKTSLPIINGFDRLDCCLEDSDEGGYLLYEIGNFSFNSSSDRNIDADSLAWYANYRNEDFVSQLHQKVDKFRKNKDITKLFIELNGLTKKNTKKR
jgi:hypothetical protein